MDDVEAAIGHLHENGQVFGDLRLPNILVQWADKGSNRIVHAMLVDFDWSGSPEVARYPIDINMEDIRWPDGVAPLMPIDRAHDLANPTRLREQLLEIC
ncbi:hypothetical protein FRB95_008303 [Tulasnella sp. JGI-2019a]|nr:hypothetical protein FRB95_008303 [Tulasnella sp. JGI-2019a]